MNRNKIFKLLCVLINMFVLNAKAQNLNLQQLYEKRNIVNDLTWEDKKIIPHHTHPVFSKLFTGREDTIMLIVADTVKNQVDNIVYSDSLVIQKKYHNLSISYEDSFVISGILNFYLNPSKTYEPYKNTFFYIYSKNHKKMVTFYIDNGYIMSWNEQYYGFLGDGIYNIYSEYGCHETNMRMEYGCWAKDDYGWSLSYEFISERDTVLNFNSEKYSRLRVNFNFSEITIEDFIKYANERRPKEKIYKVDCNKSPFRESKGMKNKFQDP